MKPPLNGLNDLNGLKKPENPYNVVELACDYDNSSWFGRLTYLWIWRFFFRFHKKEIQLKHLPKPRAADESANVHDEFLDYWQAEVERAKKANRKPNLIYPIFRQYGLRTVIMTIFCFVTVSE